MRKKKLLKFVLLSLTTLVVLLLLFVVAFLYNPFEGSLPDMRGVVPRDVDWFLRKKDLARDFPAGRFPEPVFWTEMAKSDAWKQMQAGPLVQDLRRQGIETTIRQLKETLASIEDQSAGQLDLVRDLIGTELELAGKFKPPRIEDTEWCAYMRVSMRVKMLWGALKFGFVQERVSQGGLAVHSDGPLLVFTPRGKGPVFYGARYLDCLLVGNNKALVEKSYHLATVEGSDALGVSADYIDGVESRIQEWEKRTKVPDANALEIYLRPDQADPVLKIADRWPDANKKDDMNERVLASFVNLKGWRFLTGALVFEDKSVTALAKVDLDRNKHSPFQHKFFQTGESQERGKWLDPFLSMVPLDACACAAMRMPAGEFLREMYRALEQSEREVLNDFTRKTGKYTSIQELIEKIENSLLPRTGFVFRKNEPDKGIPVSIPSPIPQIAWVFWTREGAKQPLKDFIEVLYQHIDTFRLKAFNLALGQSKEGDVAREFASQQIPGTGEFALLLIDKFFILSNSGPLIRSMYDARFHPERSIASSPQLQMFDEQKEIPSTLNGFIFVQGRPMQALLEDYQTAFDTSQQSPDPGWMAEKRGFFKAELFKERYSKRFTSVEAMDKASLAQLEKEIDVHMEEQWKKQGAGVGEPTRAAFRQMIALSRMVSAACLVVTLDPQWLKLSARALLEYR